MHLKGGAAGGQAAGVGDGQAGRIIGPQRHGRIAQQTEGPLTICPCLWIGRPIFVELMFAPGQGVTNDVLIVVEKPPPPIPVQLAGEIFCIADEEPTGASVAGIGNAGLVGIIDDEVFADAVLIGHIIAQAAHGDQVARLIVVGQGVNVGVVQGPGAMVEIAQSQNGAVGMISMVDQVLTGVEGVDSIGLVIAAVAVIHLGDVEPRGNVSVNSLFEILGRGDRIRGDGQVHADEQDILGEIAGGRVLLVVNDLVDGGTELGGVGTGDAAHVDLPGPIVIVVGVVVIAGNAFTIVSPIFEGYGAILATQEEVHGSPGAVGVDDEVSDLLLVIGAAVVAVDIADGHHRVPQAALVVPFHQIVEIGSVRAGGDDHVVKISGRKGF